MITSGRSTPAFSRRVLRGISRAFRIKLTPALKDSSPVSNLIDLFSLILARTDPPPGITPDRKAAWQAHTASSTRSLISFNSDSELPPILRTHTPWASLAIRLLSTSSSQEPGLQLSRSSLSKSICSLSLWGFPPPFKKVVYRLSQTIFSQVAKSSSLIELKSRERSSVKYVPPKVISRSSISLFMPSPYPGHLMAQILIMPLILLMTRVWRTSDSISGAIINKGLPRSSLVLKTFWRIGIICWLFVSLIPDKRIKGFSRIHSCLVVLLTK